jgi:hypothetical protein
MQHVSYFDEGNGLVVHSLDGEFYGRFRAYVEKHGGKWVERREGGQLQSVYLQFPPGTVCAKLAPSENYERHRITFHDGAVLFWFVHRITRLNSISIPYIYL